LWRSVTSIELIALHLSPVVSVLIVRVLFVSDPEISIGSWTDWTGPINPCVVVAKVSTTTVKVVAWSAGSTVSSSWVMLLEISRWPTESGLLLSIAAVLEILYVTVPGAYLKDNDPLVGATGTAGWETGGIGIGEGAAGRELPVPLQANANPGRRHQHLLRSGIFIYFSPDILWRKRTTSGDTSPEVVILAEQPVYKPGPVGLRK